MITIFAIKVDEVNFRKSQEILEHLLNFYLLKYHNECSGGSKRFPYLELYRVKISRQIYSC